ncbi:MAG: hypothetical protein FD161_2305 [Limisphaerales bacterium]|nr:MAG: hypothetical protein FD161_2305 [Limisphaerales bacterium]TXT50050.1 MAG: hypothetical protein FD140_2608 [Limisphaerales bacterium]
MIRAFSLRGARGEGGRRPDEGSGLLRRRSQPLTPALSPCFAKGEGVKKSADRWLHRLFALLLFSILSASASAHTASLTRVDAQLTTNSLTLTFQLNQPDLLQFLNARTNDAVVLMTEAEVRTLAPRIADYVQTRVRFALDTNAPVRGVLSNWPPAQLTLTREERPGEVIPAPLPLTLRWDIPATAKELELSLSLYNTVGFAALFEVLFHRGQGVPPVLQLVQSRQAMVIDLDAFQEDTRGADAAAGPPGKSGTTPAPVRGNTAWQFIELGFTHILPKGLDHILFVLGLFLLSPKLKPLLWQVTAFTLAHSITLALAVLGIFALPGRVVEPLIALSIAVVAIENLFRTEVSPWRWAAVFGFGMIHGMGFAGVLSEVGLPREQLGTALLCFNVGVELGQFAVIALAFAATKWCENRAWYGPWVRRPACVLIALAGVVWTVERLLAS